jgi:hypothetical protein
MNPHPPYDLPGDPDDEFQGDVHAADIVSPTGEEMPMATHAEVHRSPETSVLDTRSHRDDHRG